MQEFTTPGGVTVPADDNVVTALFANGERHPHRPALAYKSGDHFVDVSTADLVTKVRELAAGLISLGIEPGSRVCLFMPARIEFTYLDYAIWAAGCATVTIYETSSADQVEWIVGNSGAVGVICGSLDQRKVFDSVAERLPDAHHVFVVDDGAIQELIGLGRRVPQQQVDERVAAITHDDLGTLVYTSGTTGRPKGCALTHRNLIWETRQAMAALGDILDDQSSTLAFLPLAHILARVVQVACVTQGVQIAYASSFTQLVPEMQEFKPTFIVAVPRVFEKVFNVAQASATKGAKKRIFERATEVAVEHSQQAATGRPNRRLQAEHSLYGRLVYGKLRGAFGGRLRYALSGGAPLGERLGHFFDGAGLVILEGYGLTETTGGATVNTPANLEIGSVGRPMPGSSVRIAEDGEVLMMGGHIFRGYWQNEAATAEVLSDDGWFSSGDIGELDDGGFLRITGRKKDLIVTAGGKNVAPAVLEDLVRMDRLISQCVVVGDAKPFIACLVTLDEEELPGFAEQHGLAKGNGLTDSPAVKEAVQGAIDHANAAVSHAEAIKAFRILPHDFSIESGELTPSMKVRRPKVMENYADVIDGIYAG